MKGGERKENLDGIFVYFWGSKGKFWNKKKWKEMNTARETIGNFFVGVLRGGK